MDLHMERRIAEDKVAEDMLVAVQVGADDRLVVEQVFVDDTLALAQIAVDVAGLPWLSQLLFLPWFQSPCLLFFQRSLSSDQNVGKKTVHCTSGAWCRLCVSSWGWTECIPGLIQAVLSPEPLGAL